MKKNGTTQFRILQYKNLLKNHRSNTLFRKDIKLGLSPRLRNRKQGGLRAVISGKYRWRLAQFGLFRVFYQNDRIKENWMGEVCSASGYMARFIQNINQNKLRAVHTVQFLDGISLFTNKMHYFGENATIRLLPLRGSALLCHFQGVYWGTSPLKAKAGNETFCGSNLIIVFLLKWSILLVNKDMLLTEIQGGSNMTGTNCDLFTHK
jgi:hypothetical protein